MDDIKYKTIEAKPWGDKTLAELEIRKKYDKSYIIWSAFWIGFWICMTLTSIYN